MANPTFEAVETLARGLWRITGLITDGEEAARYAGGLLEGSITLPGLYTAAQGVEAVKAEREACARVAEAVASEPCNERDPYDIGRSRAGEEIAAAIRERGEA